MDLNKGPLFVIIIFIEVVIDLTLLLAVSSVVAGLTYSVELLITVGVVIIVLEVWLDLKYLI